MVEPVGKQIENLPVKTGVYIFRGQNQVLYVGKAANIKKRVLNHFQNAQTDHREKKITEHTERIDYIVTENETDALIEENILIKAHKPRYNIRLSDDKTYPYVRINTKEDYPSLSIVRRTANDDTKYFGPYCDVGAMRNSLKTIRRLFPIRGCKRELGKIHQRPCVYHHIGQCCAPCTGGMSKEEYGKVVNHLILFLEGRMNGIIRGLRSDMSKASSKQDYEQAAVVRDRIQDLEKTVQHVTVVLPQSENLDAIEVYRGEEGVCAQVLQVREGKIMSSESFSLTLAEEAGDEEALESFLKQYYLRRTHIPDKLVIDKRIRDSKVIGEWLSKRTSKKIEIKKPSSAELRRILALARTNARTYLEQLGAIKKTAADSVSELGKNLGLNHPPRTIECFDISNLGEKEAVGSKIVFVDGTPNKKEYRMYKIRAVSGQDDPAMMGEIVRRRFTRLLKEKRDLPDLVVVDGGITQVKAAKRQLDQLAVDMTVIGLAKKSEQIHLPDGRILELDRDSASSLLLQHIRDEAHRFAVNYHRKRREKTQFVQAG